MLSSIAGDTSKVKRKLDQSANQLPPRGDQPTNLSRTLQSSQATYNNVTGTVPPRANLNKCNMTYDDLQGLLVRVVLTCEAAAAVEKTFQNNFPRDFNFSPF